MVPQAAKQSKAILSALKALSDETRIRILHILSIASFQVNEVTEILAMGQSRISRHLKILADAGLIESQREGSWVYYKIPVSHDSVFQDDIIRLLLSWKEELPLREIDQKKANEILAQREEKRNKYFDCIGPEWEIIQKEVLHPEIYREKLVSLLPDNSTIVLDAGCGSGDFMPYLFPRAHRLIGVDSSHKMIEIARNRFLSNNNVEFIESPLEAIPLASESVDAITASMVLHHISNPVLALKEFHRILKPEGTLCIVDLEKHEQEFMRNNHADLWLGFEKQLLSDWLSKSGFIINRIDEMTTKSLFRILILQATRRTYVRN